MNRKNNTKSNMNKIQMYLFVITGILMLIYTSINYGYLDSLLGIIAGSIFISTLVTKKLSDKIHKKLDINYSLIGLLIGGLIAGLFMLPLDFFIYFRDEQITISILIVFILASIFTGSIIGFLINYTTLKRG